MLHRSLALLAAVATVGVLVACADRLEAGRACADVTGLCPQPVPLLVDTTLDAVVVDTAVAPFPGIGQDARLILAARGDTLQTRAVVRFDSLPTKYVPAAAQPDSFIHEVDSAFVTVFPVALATPPTAPVTLDVYDVDADGVDTVAAQVAALFTPARLLTSITLSPDSINQDSLVIRLPAATVQAKLLAKERLRLGFRVRSSESVQLSLFSIEGGAATHLRLRVSPDSTVAAITTFPTSLTPTEPQYLRLALRDYTVVASTTVLPPGPLLDVGALPGRRSYLRFSIPRFIAESSTVVRATLVLTQSPDRASPAAYDTLTIYALPVLAAASITDIGRAASLVGSVPSDSIRVAPADSGQRQFEVGAIVRTWVALDTTVTPRALVLRSTAEGVSAGIIQFFRREAADASVRPRLRITYQAKSTFGLP